jgi:hypothetical protein
MNDDGDDCGARLGVRPCVLMYRVGCDWVRPVHALTAGLKLSRVSQVSVMTGQPPGPCHAGLRHALLYLAANLIQVQVQVCFTSVDGQVQPLDVALQP